MADIPADAGSTINVPTTTTGTPTTLAPATIAKRAMRVVGTQTDPEVLQTALEAVQDCVNDMNIRATFDFTIANDTDVTLVEDQRDYAIPDSAFGLKELVLVKQGTTPEEIIPLGHLDWDQLNRFFHQEGNGRPIYWSAKDVFLDRNVTLSRAPDGPTATDYKLRIYYHAAIDSPPVNDSSIGINAPAQLATAIQRYVEYRLLTVYGEPNDGRRRDAYREYRDVVNGLRGMENRSRPGGPQMRLVGFTQGSTGMNGRYRNRIWWGS